jgi:hypothetical protein
MRGWIPLLIVSLTAGCNGGVSSGGSATGSSNVELELVGVDSVQLFDVETTRSFSSSVTSAVVTIDEIDAKVDVTGGHQWVPFMTTPVTVDLLKLDNTTLNTLGITTLPSSHVDALRLKLSPTGAHVVLKDGTTKPLELPDSGFVKVEGRLDLDACASGIVILDFDPRIRIEREHGRREYELSCFSHIKTEELKGGCNGGNGGSPDMAGPPDMTGSCTGVTCPSGQTCQNGGCVPDLCFGVPCPTGQTCDPSNGKCH